MRRGDKEITDYGVLEEILDKATICRIAMCDDGEPYLIPMNFGYAGRVLYFHSAAEGRKLEILRKYPRVCFEVETDTDLVTSEEPCNYSMKYRTVIGSGNAVMVDDPILKQAALNIIVKKYMGRDDFLFPEAAMQKLAVFTVKIDQMTGKQSRMG